MYWIDNLVCWGNNCVKRFEPERGKALYKCTLLLLLALLYTKLYDTLLILKKVVPTTFQNDYVLFTS